MIFNKKNLKNLSCLLCLILILIAFYFIYMHLNKKNEGFRERSLPDVELMWEGNPSKSFVLITKETIENVSPDLRKGLYIDDHYITWDIENENKKQLSHFKIAIGTGDMDKKKLYLVVLDNNDDPTNMHIELTGEVNLGSEVQDIDYMVNNNNKICEITKFNIKNRSFEKYDN